MYIFIYYSVDSQWTVRVTDNALARDLFPSDYHCLGDNENRPIKWLSPEALQHHKFTTASDVVRISTLKYLFFVYQGPNYY